MVETVEWKMVMSREEGGISSSISCYSIILRSSFLLHLKRQTDV